MFLWLFTDTTLTLVIISLTLAYFYIKFLYSYWPSRGVFQLQPAFPFGNFTYRPLKRLSIGEQVSELYHRTDEPFIGIYSFLRPTLLVRDPNLIRTILCKDFSYFCDRGIFIDQPNDPLSTQHLFALRGRRWKNVRTKLTPTFTTAKMRTIFATLLNCKNPLQKFIKKVAKCNETIDIGEMTAAFTTNSIASIGFGIDVNCFADPENPLRKNGRKVFSSHLKHLMRLIGVNSYPQLLKWTGCQTIGCEVQAFFRDMVQQMLELRRKYDIDRNDFFDLLMQMHETGTVQLNDEWHTTIENDCMDALSVDEITAHSMLFYVAAYEKIAAAMAFCLCEIAKNPDVQRRVAEEIDQVMMAQEQHKHEQKYQQQPPNDNGSNQCGQFFTYESIAKLKYLDCCIDGKLDVIILLLNVRILNRSLLCRNAP